MTEAGPARPRPHILIVDDEKILGLEIAEYLTVQGYQAEAVLSGREALARLRDDPSIEVMLTDLRMPDMDGLSLATAAIALRDDEYALEVVILTGNATIADAATAVRLRAVDFLTKPIRLATLKTAVAHARVSAVHRRAQWRDQQAARRLHTHTSEALRTLQSRVGQLQSALSQAEESESKNSDDARDAFMSLISHELRTPLAPIIGYAGMIEGKPDRLSPEELRNFAKEIRQSGERLEREFSRIADLTGLMAGSPVIRHDECRPDLILLMLARSHAARLAERGQSVSLDIQCREACQSDGPRIRQAIEELLDNASRFSPSGSVIRLAARRMSDSIGFEVHDAGPGMTEDEQHFALQPFRQVDMSLSRPKEGFGIGLTIANRIAVLLGGRLALTSTPGQGTVAALIVPFVPVDETDR